VKWKEEGVVEQRVIIFCLALLVSALGTACQPSGTNSPATSDAANANAATRSEARSAAKPTVDEIREVLAIHDKALNDKNLDALMGTFSTDPNTVVLGTGTEERWLGPQEIRAAYTEIFKDYDPGTLQTDCQWKTGGADEGGTMAWLAATCNAKDSLQGKARDYKLNVSGTVAKQDGKWCFVVLHMSNAFQPPVTK
jgi:ketosteroid isomerase-like protein